MMAGRRAGRPLAAALRGPVQYYLLQNSSPPLSRERWRQELSQEKSARTFAHFQFIPTGNENDDTKLRARRGCRTIPLNVAARWHQRSIKNRAPAGTRFQFAGVGPAIFQRGTNCPIGDSGRKHPVEQQLQLCEADAALATASPHDCHAKSRVRAWIRKLFACPATRNCKD